MFLSSRIRRQVLRPFFHTFSVKSAAKNSDWILCKQIYGSYTESFVMPSLYKVHTNYFVVMIVSLSTLWVIIYISNIIYYKKSIHNISQSKALRYNPFPCRTIKCSTYVRAYYIYIYIFTSPYYNKAMCHHIESELIIRTGQKTNRENTHLFIQDMFNNIAKCI